MGMPEPHDFFPAHISTLGLKVAFDSPHALASSDILLRLEIESEKLAQILVIHFDVRD